MSDVVAVLSQTVVSCSGKGGASKVEESLSTSRSVEIIEDDSSNTGCENDPPDKEN